MHARLFSVGIRSDHERNPDVVLVKPLTEYSKSSLCAKGEIVVSFHVRNSLYTAGFHFDVQLSSMTVPGPIPRRG